MAFQKLPLGCAGREVPLRKRAFARKWNNLNINLAVHTIHYYLIFKKYITNPLWPFQMNPVWCLLMRFYECQPGSSHLIWCCDGEWWNAWEKYGSPETSYSESSCSFSFWRTTALLPENSPSHAVQVPEQFSSSSLFHPWCWPHGKYHREHSVQLNL